jgi:hypothetical protein
VVGLTTEFGRHGKIWVLKLTLSGDVEWQRAYGGNFMDYGWSIQQTRDGGYVVAGYTESFDQSIRWLDATMIKLDSSGDITWERTYGGPGNDLAWKVLQTRDGGYVLAGYYQRILHEEKDLFVLKLNANGDVFNCGLIGFPTNIVHETHYPPSDTNVTPLDSSLIGQDTNAISEGSDAVLTQICPASMFRVSGKPDL